ELGTPLRELIYDIGGGIPNRRELKAIIPGGSSTTVMTPDQIDTALDFNSVAGAGSQLGAAAVIVIDDRACMVQLALRSTQFYMHESCGKCTPCREGTRWMVQLLQKLEDGRAEQSELDLLLSVCDRVLGKCLCALGDFAAGPVVEYVRNFREEFQRQDRKSTRLNSSHLVSSYAVFCLKKKTRLEKLAARFRAAQPGPAEDGGDAAGARRQSSLRRALSLRQGLQRGRRLRSAALRQRRV